MNIRLDIIKYEVKGTDITLERKSTLLWAVKRQNYRLNCDGLWDYEPLPSNRTREWVVDHVFLLERAVTLVKELKDRGDFYENHN